MDVAVKAMPVSAPASASLTFDCDTSVETSVPTAPDGAPASSFTAASTGVTLVLRTGASLVLMTLTVARGRPDVAATLALAPLSVSPVTAIVLVPWLGESLVLR